MELQKYEKNWRHLAELVDTAENGPLKDCQKNTSSEKLEKIEKNIVQELGYCIVGLFICFHSLESYTDSVICETIVCIFRGFPPKIENLCSNFEVNRKITGHGKLK